MQGKTPCCTGRLAAGSSPGARRWDALLRAHSELAGVAVWMGRAPTPGGLDDFIDIFKLRFPLELPFRFFLTCYQASRIAGAPRAFDYWNRMAENFAARIQHFSDRCSAACSQVERIASLRRERQKMRRSDVSDMNVISD